MCITNTSVLVSHAAVTNYHKLSDSTSSSPDSFGSQKVEMDFSGLKSRCWQGLVVSGGSRRGFVSLPFPASRGFLHSLAHGPFFHLQCHSIFKSTLHHFDTLLLLSHLLWLIRIVTITLDLTR